MSIRTPLARLADIAAGWQQQPLSENLAWAARRSLLDWFATTLPGTTLPPATLLAKALSPYRGPGNAVCYVDGKAGDPRHAALLNGTASHIVEFDDIFRDGGYHPGSSTISAALALAQDRDVTLEQLHRAIIAGYDIGCRVSLAIQPSHYRFWHITGTVGTIGAAVASAMILNCDSAAISHAISLATSFAGGHQQNLQGDGMAKALHPGHAAEAGLLAALATAQGVTASPDSLHGEKGFAAATSDSTGNWQAALAGSSDETPILRMTIKNHGCCGHIFPALDGLDHLCRTESIKPDQIKSIHVAGYGATQQMCDRPDPQSAQEARFSVQYCLAAQMILGAVRLGAFTPDSLSRPDIRELAKRITVSEDPELTAAYPAKRMARLTVSLQDGRELNHFQLTRKGDPEAPLSDSDLIAKYDELAVTKLNRDDADKLRELILYGVRLPGVITQA